MSDEPEVTQLFIPGLEPDDEDSVVEVSEEPVDPAVVRVIIESMRATLRAQQLRNDKA